MDILNEEILRAKELMGTWMKYNKIKE